MDGRPAMSTSCARAVGALALVASAMYFVSDVLEAVQGGFSPGQLWLTLVAEAAMPIVVIGLYLAQRPQISRTARIPALGYAYAYVYFTGSVVFALVRSTPNYASLVRDLGVWMTVHGALMVVTGVWLGFAVVRAGVVPRWTGAALILGVVAVASTQGLPESVQVAAAGVRALAFAGMGTAVFLRHRPMVATDPPPDASRLDRAGDPR